MKKKLLFTAMVALLLLFAATGCTNSQVLTVVKDIAVYTEQAAPIIQELLPVISALDATGAQPPDPAIAQYGILAQTDVTLMSELCKAYVQSPDSTTYARITAAVDALARNTDAAALAANKITNPNTRQKFLIGFTAISALAHIMDGFIQSTQTAQVVAATAHRRAIKFEQVSALYTDQDKQRVTAAFGGVPFPVLAEQEARREQ